MNRSNNKGWTYEEMFKHLVNDEVNARCKPPRDSYYFIPSIDLQVDTQFTDPNRRIFEGVAEKDYYNTERKRYKEIDIAIEKRKSQDCEFASYFPDNYNRFDGYRFHQSTHFYCPTTLNTLLDHFKWRKGWEKLTYENNVLEILNSGCIYVHGRDSRFRPIIVCDFEKFFETSSKYSEVDIEKTVIKFCDYIIGNMLVPGKVENWILICVVGSVSLWSFPDHLKRLLCLMQENYKARLFRNYVIGLSSFQTFIWNIIKLFLDEVIVSKFVFLEEDNLAELQSLINPKQLEVKFNGKAENVEGKLLFPPIIPSEDFLLDSDDRNNVLISEEEYHKRYNMSFSSSFSEELKKGEK